MKDIIKGGLACLLSCFIAYCGTSQPAFLVQKDPGQEDYGVIASPLVSDAIVEAIESNEISFQQWSSFFTIRTSTSTRQVLGEYTVKDNRICFTPRFLPDPDVQYIATFSFEQLGQVITLKTSKKELQEVITFEGLKNTITRILDLAPSQDTLPANLLRGYVYFSSPMGFGNPYDHIALLNSQGEQMQDVFVELPEGLWNDDRTRLTLLFHPGRVKRGVGPNVKQGSILEPGEQYQLTISQAWMDANGNPLDDTYRKEFIAGPAIRSTMELDDWKIGSEEDNVIIETGRPVDLEMSRRMLRILDANDVEFPFETVKVSENQIILTSTSLQSGANYRLEINPKLEDICGNTFLNPFDYKEGSRQIEGETLALPFTMN